MAAAYVASAPMLATQSPADATPAVSPLTLVEALRLAEERNEDAAIAAARLARAEATVSEAWATLLPSLELNGTYTRRAREVTRRVEGEELVIQAIDALSGTASLTAPLFDAQALPLLRGARHALEAQTFESRELRRALAHQVATTYYAVLAAERLLVAADRRSEVARATVEEADVRLRSGLAARNEKTRSELELAAAELAATELRNDAAAARLALGFLIAERLDDRPLVEPPADERADPAERPLAELVDAALTAREDVAAREARAAAAAEQALAPRWGIFPDLEMRGTYRRTNEGGLSGNEEDWNLAAVLTWELWDGGVRRARAAGLAAAQREAELAAASLRREVELDVRTALNDLATARAALRQAEVNARVAEQNAEEVRELFRVGLASALERADANVAAFEAAARRERTALALALSRLALDRALGAWPLSREAPLAVGALPAVPATPTTVPSSPPPPEPAR